MAKLHFKGKTISDEASIKSLMREYGVMYERWGVRASADAVDDEILSIYAPEVERLKKERGYQTADMIALRPETPNLAVIAAKFDKEHHHSDDEVRFTVEGEGVFEISTNASTDAENLKFTAEPGDLIVIPAMRRHLFYLTPKQTIRTIRLFKTKEGWEAIYPRPDKKE